VDPATMDASGRTLDGKKHTASLEHAVKFAGWPTTRKTDGDKGVRSDEGAYRERTRRANGYDLCSAAMLTGWPTASARDWKDGRASEETLARNARPLNEVARLSGWDTPHAPRAHDSDASRSTYLNRALGCGATPASSPAPTESSAGYQLNPRFSLWLMGYADEWASCGERAMQSCRSSRRSSSKRIST
jgi:hypothetical protein